MTLTFTAQIEPIALAPKDGDELLLFIPGRGWVAGRWLVMGGGWVSADTEAHLYGAKPTHFMRYPPRPLQGHVTLAA